MKHALMNRWRHVQKAKLWLRVLFVLAAIFLGYFFINWAFFDAVFFAPSAEACDGMGACWAFFTHQWYVMFFGVYPHALFVFAMLASACLLGAILFVMAPWSWRLSRIWLVLPMLALAIFFMQGGWLDSIDTNSWGGLPLTLFVFVFAAIFSLPIGIVLMLGRVSKSFIMRTISSFLVETVRGVPLVSLLFMASFLLPLLLPSFLGSVDKLLRVCAILSIFVGVYISEILRGSMHALPKGQKEAAQALGLSYTQVQLRVLLPQVLLVSIPGLTNITVGVMKSTSFLVAVGMLDFLSTTRIAYEDPKWISVFFQAMFFVALMYWGVYMLLARYGKFLEERFGRQKR